MSSKRNKAKSYTMFIDETGVSGAKNSPFTVTGVIFQNKYAYDNEQTGETCELKKKLDRFKLDTFGRVIR